MGQKVALDGMNTESEWECSIDCLYNPDVNLFAVQIHLKQLSQILLHARDLLIFRAVSFSFLNAYDGWLIWNIFQQQERQRGQSSSLEPAADWQLQTSQTDREKQVNFAARGRPHWAHTHLLTHSRHTQLTDGLYIHRLILWFQKYGKYTTFTGMMTVLLFNV